MNGCITFEYGLLTLLLITTMIILSESLQVTLATSPSFVRKEMSDTLDNDGWNYLEGKFTTGHRYADLSSITYSSNGKFLNATYYFNHAVEYEPVGANYTAYGMLVDVDSDYSTGWQGYDYMMKILWENNTKSWTYQLQEWSSDSRTRVLEKKSNFTSFLDDKESPYVYLSLDLEKLAFPDKYLVVFFTDYDFQDGGVKYEISDFSNDVRIPPPQIVVSTSPNSVALRPGEKKTVEVHVNSSAQGIVNLTTNHIEDLQMYFIPDERELSPNGVFTTTLTIKAASYAVPSPYTLLILADFAPGSSVFTELDQEEVLSVHTTLPLTVLPSLTFTEAFGNIISGVSVVIFVLVPTIISLRPTVLTKRFPDIINLERSNLIQVNASIIAGVLIFLSLEGFNAPQQTQVTFITANIVFPFAISTIASLVNYNKFAMRLVIAGFVNLMISVILIAFIGL